MKFREYLNESDEKNLYAKQAELENILKLLRDNQK
jgi:hypothetical protein